MILTRMTSKYQEFHKIDRAKIMNKVTFATVITKGTDFSQVWTVNRMEYCIVTYHVVKNSILIMNCGEL